MLDYCLNHPQILPALMLIVAVATTLLVQARTLPWQNVISAAGLIALISGVIQAAGLKTGLPFGHFFYARDFGPRLFKVLPWALPCIWTVAILNARGVARLILRPWRERPNHGLRLVALTCVLVVFFDAALEPFAIRVNHYWFWRISKTAVSWYGAPLSSFFGWAFATLLIQVVATPWLLHKKLNIHAPPDFYPLLIWLIVMLLMVVADASNQLGGAALFILSTAILTSILAAHNARLTPKDG